MTQIPVSYVPLAPVKLIKSNGLVKSYGLGSATASARGEAVLNAVAAIVSSGDRVIVGPGEFDVASPIVLDVNATAFAGQGNDTVINYTGTGMAVRLYADDLTVGNFWLNSAEQGIGFDTGSGDFPSGHVATGFLVHDVVIYGRRDLLMFYQTEKANTGVFRNCSLRPQGIISDFLVDFRCAIGADILCEGCDFQADAAHDAVVLVEGAGGTVRLKDCRAYGSSSGSIVQSGSVILIVQNTEYDATIAVGDITFAKVFGVTPGAIGVALLDDTTAAAARTTIGVDEGNAPIVRISSLGVKTAYGVGAANSTALGTALASAVSAMSTGDSVIVFGPATYTITASLNPPAGTSLIGIGKPLISASGTTDATIIVDNDDILIRGFSISTNLLGIGKLTATPLDISGIVIDSVDVTITSIEGSGIQWSQIIGGGATSHVVNAQIRNCNLVGGSSSGFGIYANLDAAGFLEIIDTNTNGETDGILIAGNASAEVHIFGGEHLSTLDAVTSGGPTVRVTGARMRGTQADAYSDSGPVYLHGCDHRYTHDAGNQTYDVIGGRALQLYDQEDVVFPVTMGGTGLATATGVIIGTGTTAMTVKTNPGGAFVGTTDAQTLTNKTLTSPIIASISNTGTLTLPTSTDTLVGRATTDTLTNKTLTSPTINSPSINGGTMTILSLNDPTESGYGTLNLDDNVYYFLDTLTNAAGISASQISCNEVNAAATLAGQTITAGNLLQTENQLQILDTSSSTFGTIFLDANVYAINDSGGTPATVQLGTICQYDDANSLFGTITHSDGEYTFRDYTNALATINASGLVAGAIQVGSLSTSGAVTFNDAGADVDVRIEGDSLTHMFFLDASAATENIALVAAAAPNWQTMDRGLFIGDASTAPTGNPSSGAFLYSESGILKTRSSGGRTTSIGQVVRTIQITVVSPVTSLSTGDGKAYAVVPASMNGGVITAVHARVITAGTTGTTDIQIANVTDAVDVLSTKLTIDSAETGSDTATPAVINTSNDDLSTNDLLRIDIDAVSTTAPQGLIVTIEVTL